MRKVSFWVAAGVVFYALAVFLAYRATPLGQTALLDAREQQVLAHQMAEGNLPPGPLYRAPLYAGVLSLFYRLGADDSSSLLAGQLLNLALHLLTALAIYKAGLLLWNKRAGAFVAAALYALYPVALYLSVDLLDTILAQALVAWGLAFGLKAQKTEAEPAAPKAFLSGLFFSLAVLARPQFLPVALAAGGTLAFIYRRELFKRLAPAAAAVQPPLAFGLAFLLVLGAFSGAELLRTGQLYLLPAQGGYNLYAANRAGAGGESFVQQREIADLPDGMNPAYAESELLYREATKTAPANHATVERYWSERFFKELCANPAHFVTLYLRRLYAFFHVHEGYNNKTYAFEKAQNPLLCWNPLNFVFVSLLALLPLLFYRPLPKPLAGLLCLALVYVLGAALFYASDRFRLPLVIFALVLGAGAPSALLQLWSRLKKREEPQALLKAGALCVWALFFSLPLFGVARRDTTLADRLILGQAALKVGDDSAAATLFSALEKEPGAPAAAIDGLLQARYNLLLAGGQAPTPDWCRGSLRLFLRLKYPSGEARFVGGLCRYHLEGDRGEWRALVWGARTPEKIAQDSIAALLLTGPLSPDELNLLKRWDSATSVRLSLALMGSQKARAALVAAMGETQTRATLNAWQKLFDRRAPRALNETNVP